jgi:hypothetical protein
VAGWNAMPEHKMAFTAYVCPIKIKQKMKKRRPRREWHRLRTAASKILVNAATQEILDIPKFYHN